NIQSASAPDPSASALASPGLPYRAQIVASGGTGPLTLTYSVDTSNGTLSQYNLSIAQSGDTLTISGTPAGQTTWGSIDIDVTATDGAGHAVSETFPLNVLYTPAQIRQAYGINDVILDGGVLADGSGQTVAIVVAGDAPNLVSSTDPNFESSDLYRYDQMMGIDAYNASNTAPHFLKINEFGGTAYPKPSQDASG